LPQARPDGLYSYSHTERTGVSPIDGTKMTMCIIPAPTPAEWVREVDIDELGSGYALVASTDAKSGRDAVDIYDSVNKLVAFHLLLSPGHRAIHAAGVTTLPTQLPDGSVRGGRSSAAVITSGGALLTFTEKLTEEKISLLVQKHLYSAAIVVAFADPSYEASDITSLYQQHAEHLYRKGDFSGAMDQYIYTIGSLESSHVIFRYLDAPKIPLLVKYLENLRAREIATPVHNELLRTCYLKLNDVQAADAIAVLASWSINDASLESLLSNLSTRPKDALATICSLEAHQTAEVLVIHGASLARVLPRETAGVVISLCVGTYTPRNLADASMAETLGAAAATTTAAAMDLKRMINTNDNPKARVIEPYPVELFASAFVEHPKILRLILAHCNRNKCPLTPSLRRTLLELTLAEWNQARRSGDTEAEKLRYKEAIAVGFSSVDAHFYLYMI
jgi:vacuolar protein sorting-associated protein 11